MSMHLIHTTELSWQKTPIDGVTSKDLVHESHGTAKLIRLAPNAVYPTHQHPNRDEYVFVLVGKATLSVGDDRQDASPDDFTFIPMGISHALANYTETEVVLWAGAIIPGPG